MVKLIDKTVCGSLAGGNPKLPAVSLRWLNLVHHGGRIRQGTPGRWTPAIEGIVL